MEHPYFVTIRLHKHGMGDSQYSDNFIPD